MESNPEFEVMERKATITVPHQGKKITFVADCIGPSPYDDAGERINHGGLLKPTFAEVTSLIYSATRNKDDRYALIVLSIIRNNRLWGFNTVIFEPERGAFISDRNREHVCVPFGFKGGENSLEELVRNRFVLALAEGEEGAEKLAKIAESLKQKPYVRCPEPVDKTTTRVASLGSGGRGELGQLGIHCDFYYGGNDYSGCAYGLVK